MRLLFTIIIIFIMINNWGIVEGCIIKNYIKNISDNINNICEKKTELFLNNYNNSLIVDLKNITDFCEKKTELFLNNYNNSLIVDLKMYKYLKDKCIKKYNEENTEILLNNSLIVDLKMYKYLKDKCIKKYNEEINYGIIITILTWAFIYLFL